MSRRDELYADLDDYISERMKRRPLEEKPVEEKQESEGWWSRVKKKFSKEEMYEESDETSDQPLSEVKPTDKAADETVTDMKEVSRIALDVLKRMDGEQVREFKATQDYEKFKTLLRKYQMIK